MFRVIRGIPVRRQSSYLTKAVKDPENAKKVFERAMHMAHNYKGYIKTSGSIGAVVGVTFAGAHMLDVLDERKMSRKEMLMYPIVGTVGGAFLGVTAPVWVLFAPLTYVFGHETMSTIAKTILAGLLLSSEEDE